MKPILLFNELISFLYVIVASIGNVQIIFFLNKLYQYTTHELQTPAAIIIIIINALIVYLIMIVLLVLESMPKQTSIEAKSQ